MTTRKPLRITQGLRTTWRGGMWAWDRLSIYLPLLLMGALALATYWLARHTPTYNAPDAAREVTHDPDYFMRRFTVRTFGEDGQFKSEVKGDEARHYPDTDTLNIDRPRMRRIGPEGQRITATANAAISNGDGSEVQLIGRALIVREAMLDTNGNALPRMEFHGEFLHAFVQDERVQSHKPVILIRGGDQFSGDQFSFNHLDGVAELTGRVRGVLMPRSALTAAPAPTR